MINLKSLLSYIFFLVALLVSSAADAQQNSAIVDCKLNYPDTIKAGDSVLVKVVLDIAPGFYIYAPTEMNQMQSLQIMQLIFVPSVTSIKKSGELIIPTFDLKDSFEVYKGKNVIFSQRFATEKEMKPGAYILKIKLITQACNDQVCFPPATEVMDAVIHVLPR